MTTAEDANSGDVEEGGYLAVLTTTGGKVLQRSSSSAPWTETPPVQNSLQKNHVPGQLHTWNHQEMFRVRDSPSLALFCVPSILIN